MQSSHQSQRTRRNRKDILLLAIISFFSCSIGILLGVGGILLYERTVPPVIEPDLVQPDTPSPLPQLGAAPTGDGFFISVNGTLIKLPEFVDDSQLDFRILPSTRDSRPVFAIQGTNLPLGNLRLIGYLAGIGVDLTFTQAGAVINSVFEDSPARIAGLQPGEIILSQNDEPVKSPMMYTVGRSDLIGVMQDKVTLVVVSGTSNRTVEMPRTRSPENREQP